MELVVAALDDAVVGPLDEVVADEVVALEVEVAVVPLLEAAALELPLPARQC